MTSPTAEPASSASSTLYFGPWYRRSPFFEKTLEAGCSAYDIYNHMYLPGYYADPIEEYWALLNDVTVWDVSVERIVEITGPDASIFTNMLTCRDLTTCAVGQGKYMIVTAEDGGIVNDPVLLRVEENRWWLALADSDAGLYARGVAVNSGMDVTVREPEVYPIQVQGPRSRETLRKLFGDAIDGIKYYWTLTTELDGIPVVIAGPAGPARSATRSTCATRRAAPTCGTASSTPAPSSGSGRSRRSRHAGSRPASSTTART
jgi:aminomethyltransferase